MLYQIINVPLEISYRYFMMIGDKLTWRISEPALWRCRPGYLRRESAESDVAINSIIPRPDEGITSVNLQLNLPGETQAKRSIKN